MACCIKNCINNNKKCKKIGISYHKFPKQKDRLSEWLHSIGSNLRTNIVINKLGICSKHFDSHMVDGNRLRYQAVPRFFDNIENQSFLKSETINCNLAIGSPEPIQELAALTWTLENNNISIDDVERDGHEMTQNFSPFDKSPKTRHLRYEVFNKPKVTMHFETDTMLADGIKKEIFSNDEQILSQTIEFDDIKRENDESIFTSNTLSKQPLPQTAIFSATDCLIDGTMDIKIKDETITSYDPVVSSINIKEELPKSSTTDCLIDGTMDIKIEDETITSYDPVFSSVNIKEELSKKSFAVRNPLCLKLQKESIAETDITDQIQSNDKSCRLERPFKCAIEFCAKRFARKYGLARHMKIHTEERKLECEICSKKYLRKSHLQYHLLLHTGLKPFECFVCRRTFPIMSELKRHLMVHTGENKRHSCDVCKRKFTSMRGCEDHKRLHSGEFLECGMCSKKFSSKVSILRHMDTHMTEKHFKCDRCPRSFYRNDLLQRHKRTNKHTDRLIKESRKKQCKVCLQDLFGHAAFVEHRRLNIKCRKQVECDVCFKKFSTNSHLNEHKRIHTGVKNFECDHCSKKFTYKSALSFHLKTLTTEKPYACDVCSSKYWQKTRLLEHKLIHSGQLPFQCPDCDKKFARKFELKDHQKRHNKSGHSFECTICSKKFLKVKFLNEHRKTHELLDTGEAVKQDESTGHTGRCDFKRKFKVR